LHSRAVDQVCKTGHAVQTRHQKRRALVEAVLGFDCILRYIEMEQGQMLRQVSKLLMANKVVGIYQGLLDQKAGAPLDVIFQTCGSALSRRTASPGISAYRAPRWPRWSWAIAR